MNKIMTELHQDHIHLARVLCVLDKQLEMLKSDADADLFLMIDILDYIQHYPDLVHHPKEDIVYEVFKARSTEGANIIEALMNEHQQLPSTSKKLHELLDGAANGIVFVSRQELYEKIQEFSVAQRKHMNLEEEKLFPLINKIMTDDDWAKVDATMPNNHDPLFGANLEECYQNLYQSIKTECG